MAESVFPTDHFRRMTVDRQPIPWSIHEVEEAIAHHFELGRNPDVDERVADLWDAAFYFILAKLIWEGWLVDWKKWVDDSGSCRPDAEVPTRLFGYCEEAVEVLAYAGALRTRYEDDSIDEILCRFPSNGRFEPWPDNWAEDQHFFAECCSKVEQLIPLHGQLIRLQEHFESSLDSALEFQIVPLGTRTVGNYPGTVLDVYVGFIQHEEIADEDAIAAGNVNPVTNENTSERMPMEPDPVKPNATSLRRPPENAFKAWRLRDLSGITSQTELAENLTKQGVQASQGQVSRWLKKVDEYMKAGNVLPPITPLTSQPQSIDPKVIDMGERQDSRTPRQRDRGDTEND